MTNCDRLFAKYASSTMVNLPTFYANLELVERVRAVPGAIVECGTWRGGMIAAIAETLGPDRDYVLCDSFQGLPPAQPIDGPAARLWQATDPNNCRASVEDVCLSMSQAGVRTFRVVEGWFEDTLDTIDGPIALLRLDADWYDSTMCCLQNLFHQVTSGGIVVIDDYYVWDGCACAVHEFLGNPGHRRSERIREHGGVAYIQKGRAG